MSAQRWIDLAESLLADDNPRRWAHDLAVIEKAGSLANVVGPADASLLVSAAAVHDLGFVPALRQTGFQPLDAALYLSALDDPPPDRLVALVAHSAAGRIEGSLRGHDAAYERYEDEQSAVRDALWFCCLTTSADGFDTTLAERVAGWDVHYAGDEIVQEYRTRALPELEAALARTRERMAAAA